MVFINLLTITMFRLIAFTTIVSISSAQCTDNLFFEKNQITQYTRFSKSRGYSKTSVPALDWVEDLQKNDFGEHIYDQMIKKDDILMLFAYKSPLGLHIYKLCHGIPDKVTGPILQNPENLRGYHFKMNDEHRLKKHLVDYDFTIFGADESALRREIVEDRAQIVREKERLMEEKWNEKSIVEKFYHYFWILLIISFILGLLR